MATYRVYHHHVKRNRHTHLRLKSGYAPSKRPKVAQSTTVCSSLRLFWTGVLGMPREQKWHAKEAAAGGDGCKKQKQIRRRGRKKGDSYEG